MEFAAAAAAAAVWPWNELWLGVTPASVSHSPLSVINRSNHCWWMEAMTETQTHSRVRERPACQGMSAILVSIQLQSEVYTTAYSRKETEESTSVRNFEINVRNFLEKNWNFWDLKVENISEKFLEEKLGDWVWKVEINWN